MTENQLRNKVVETMKGWIGLKEADGSHKKILDIYNSHSPLPRGWKMLTSNAWCAATVSAAFIKNGLTDIAPVECSCAEMIKLYKKIGCWIEDDTYTPKPGDLIMYDWDDTGKGDNTGHPEHVGMVVSVVARTVTVIEGNKNDAVGYRSLSLNGRYIRGYCVPNFASKATSAGAKPVKIEAAKSRDKKAGSGKKLIVTASELNIRSAGRLVKSNIIGTLEKGDTVVWYGYYTGDFYLVQLPKSSGYSTGYVSRKYLK